MTYQHKPTSFNRTALALALAFSFGSSASIAAQDSGSDSPQIQTCSIMEILYQGDKAVSYRLPCQAGEWELSYTGAVPAGVGKTSTTYRLTVNHPQSGAGFTLDRRLDLPSVTVLGRALFREAALLADGDLALRDCESAGCSSYKPLGAVQRIQASKEGAVISRAGLARAQIEPIRATITDDRYEKPQPVQSFSPATIVAPSGQADTAKIVEAEVARNEALQQENAKLKVERTNLQKKVDEQAKQIDRLIAGKNQQNQASLTDTTKEVRLLPARVEDAPSQEALSTTGRTKKGVGTFDLPVKTTQDSRPVRAPAPSAAKAVNGTKPLILPTEYYRITPDGGKVKVYQVEAPAIVEIVAPPK